MGVKHRTFSIYQKRQVLFLRGSFLMGRWIYPSAKRKTGKNRPADRQISSYFYIRSVRYNVPKTYILDLLNLHFVLKKCLNRH